MKNFDEIIENMKDIVSFNVKGAVLDSAIANELGVSSGLLATNKSRNKVMYEELLVWCAKKKISINSLLFEQSAESLIAPTNELYMNRQHFLHAQ
jgi:hypothetical protein